MKPPVVSVVMATYNHAAYVAQAIKSVLAQRDVAFEFLIADDGSSDTTREVVEGFKDVRIRFFPHQINRGASVVTNELIERATGEFVALINSDDYWADEDKLAFQLDILRTSPELGASFGRARFVDKRGNVISKKSLSFGSVFDQANRTQGEWLRYFLDHGNCLCHPTVMIRRKCYEELGGYSNNLRQLPDYDLWIRLVKRYPIHISERELICFRVMPGENVSSQSVTNSIRTMNEHYLIAETFFQDVGVQQLKDGFLGLLKYPEIPSSIHLEIEKVLLFFLPNAAIGKAYRMIGMIKLNHLLASCVHREVLEEAYGIDGQWFQAKMGEIDILRPKFLAMIAGKTIGVRRALKKILKRDDY
ncbi:glycosyltransferase involved in cell wall biosynthesis [Pseudomonas sp. 3296]|uniref:glycosyltransferase n=1 Tax=Pseudomonas sp. 3296 TaxID=2817753 RepID=UPI00285C28E4|nr:glycosyltransferase [Pseudomonas sp. 3296]MDR6918650.1 glycosyltransferase involved in cell wall biosynthesis [Pseudomonas sp. 3296]